MKTPLRIALVLCSLHAFALAARAGQKDKTLDVYWIDSEGGGSTLIVTPNDESVLIDTGNPGGRDPGRIVAAAKAAGLDEEIRSMPMGMHTYLSEGGGNVSGGQRQRLLIARALLQKPRIIILDEATSALDNRTQAIVTESMNRLKVTRVVVAHRLSTIRHADLVLVLDQGRVIERGTHAELLARGGHYAALYQQFVQVDDRK